MHYSCIYVCVNLQLSTFNAISRIYWLISIQCICAKVTIRVSVHTHYNARYVRPKFTTSNTNRSSMAFQVTMRWCMILVTTSMCFIRTLWLPNGNHHHRHHRPRRHHHSWSWWNCFVQTSSTNFPVSITCSTYGYLLFADVRSIDLGACMYRHHSFHAFIISR